MCLDIQEYLHHLIPLYGLVSPIMVYSDISFWWQHSFHPQTWLDPSSHTSLFHQRRIGSLPLSDCHQNRMVLDP